MINSSEETIVYILECGDNSYYTGMTRDLEKRLKEHRSGLCKYTRGRFPLKIVYKEILSSRQKAAQREYEIKSWRRGKKKKLIVSLHRGTW